MQHQWTYDVFLSFRGEDNRRNFTGHLYNALRHKGIHTFRDDQELIRGRDISALLSKQLNNQGFQSLYSQKTMHLPIGVLINLSTS